MGLCRDTGDVFQFTARASGRELKKREITLIDASNASVCFISILYKKTEYLTLFLLSDKPGPLGNRCREFRRIHSTGYTNQRS